MIGMKSLCEYRHIFGIEGQGAHSYRLFNIAVVDTLLTILGAWLIARYTKMPFLFVLVLVLILGTIVHRVFCVKTTITKIVFGNNY